MKLFKKKERKHYDIRLGSDYLKSTPNCVLCKWKFNYTTKNGYSAFVCNAQGEQLTCKIYGNDNCKALYLEKDTIEVSEKETINKENI